MADKTSGSPFKQLVRAPISGRCLAFASAAMLLAGLSAPAAEAFNNERNNVMFATASGVNVTCRRASRTDNFDISSSSRVSTLYRLNRRLQRRQNPATTYIPITAKEIGVVDAGNLEGLWVLAGLDPDADPITRSTLNWVQLSATERIVDVCGLAGGHGQLFGTAALEETGIHVLIKIDPDTAKATLLEVQPEPFDPKANDIRANDPNAIFIGSLNADTGTATPLWDQLPDASLCHPMDLLYDTTRAEFQAILSCRFFFDPIVANRTPTKAMRTMLTHIDPETGAATTLPIIREISNLTGLQEYDQRVNAMMAWSYIPGGTPTEVLQTRLTLARRHSNGELVGVNNQRVLYYQDSGAIDFSRQPVEDPAQVGSYGGNVPYWDFYLNIDEPVPPPRLPGQTTTMLYDHEHFERSSFDPADLAEPLYRVYLGDYDPPDRPFIIPPRPGSVVEVLDPATALPDPDIPLRDIIDFYTFQPILGVQALAFVDYPDSKDRVEFDDDDPEFDEVTPCTPAPRGEASCQVTTTSSRGSKFQYKAEFGDFYWKTHRGYKFRKSDFGDPTSSSDPTRYALCVYAREDDPEDKFELLEGRNLTLVAGRQASKRKLWDEKSSGYKFKKKNQTLEIKLKSVNADDGRYAKVEVEAVSLDFPPLPVNDGGITFQLQSSDGLCIGSHFSKSSLEKNTSSTTRGKTY